jgi:exopolyphosphatase/guanosine-5'-triphosphate,3'-diphosphate pyrophosphatase
LKLAAIDIGSNAARLLIVEVVNGKEVKPEYNKLNFLRVPLRLGFDVFEHQYIPERKIHMLLHTMQAFKSLMDVYEVTNYKAVATSAMRDSLNSAEVIERVKAETGVVIEVISGDQEAAIIYQTQIVESPDREHLYLYIDVGGGSTELTFFNEEHIVAKESFNIGTIRLLKNQVDAENWAALKAYTKENIRGHKRLMVIGSGGNINKVFSLSKKKDGKPLSLQLLKDYYNELHNVSLEDRIKVYKLKEDRADVIVPALQIYIAIMRWAGADEIYVPKIGVSDGIIHQLYREGQITTPC